MKSDYELDDEMALDYEDLDTYESFKDTLINSALVIGMTAALAVFVLLNLYQNL